MISIKSKDNNYYHEYFIEFNLRCLTLSLRLE